MQHVFIAVAKGVGLLLVALAKGTFYIGIAIVKGTGVFARGTATGIKQVSAAKDRRAARAHELNVRELTAMQLKRAREEANK